MTCTSAIHQGETKRSHLCGSSAHRQCVVSVCLNEAISCVMDVVAGARSGEH